MNEKFERRFSELTQKTKNQSFFEVYTVDNQEYMTYFLIILIKGGTWDFYKRDEDNDDYERSNIEEFEQHLINAEIYKLHRMPDKLD